MSRHSFDPVIATQVGLNAAFIYQIPSIPASEGRMPETIGYASLFQDQVGSGGAFDETNLRRQMERAAANPSPPWRQGKRGERPASARRNPHYRRLIPPPNWKATRFGMHISDTASPLVGHWYIRSISVTMALS